MFLNGEPTSAKREVPQKLKLWLEDKHEELLRIPDPAAFTNGHVKPEANGVKS